MTSLFGILIAAARGEIPAVEPPPRHRFHDWEPTGAIELSQPLASRSDPVSAYMALPRRDDGQSMRDRLRDIERRAEDPYWPLRGDGEDPRHKVMRDG